jgi:hypothetical protein
MPNLKLQFLNLSLREQIVASPNLQLTQKTCYELNTLCTKLSIFHHSLTHIHVLRTYGREIKLNVSQHYIHFTNTKE